MKKQKLTYYLLLILFYVVLSAKSCGDENEVENQEFHKQIQQIENSMLNDSLDNQSLRAFEEKAKQKVIYFGELSTLIYNHRIDSSMYNNAVKQITNLFLNDNVKINFSLDKNSSERNYTVSEFLNLTPDQQHNSIQINNDSFHLLQPLYKKGKFFYHGKLQFVKTIQGKTESSNAPTIAHSQQVDFYVKKIKKKFGTNALFIWQVFLGDITFMSQEKSS